MPGFPKLPKLPKLPNPVKVVKGGAEWVKDRAVDVKDAAVGFAKDHWRSLIPIGVGLLVTVAIIATVASGGTLAPLTLGGAALLLGAGGAGGLATYTTDVLLNGKTFSLKEALIQTAVGAVLTWAVPAGGSKLAPVLKKVGGPAVSKVVSLLGGGGDDAARGALNEAGRVAGGIDDIADDVLRGAGRHPSPPTSIPKPVDDVASAVDDAAKGAAPAVERGGLDALEHAQAQRFAEWSGHSVKGAPKSQPGFDAWLEDGTKVSFKATNVANPRNVARELNDAYTKAVQNGMREERFIVSIEARNVGKQELLDYLETDPHFAKKLGYDMFRDVYVNTKDGWVILKSDGAVLVTTAPVPAPAAKPASVGFLGKLDR